MNTSYRPDGTPEIVSDSAAQSLRVTSIAFYLPQFHPGAENDGWWGAGFTEWTNVARARPLFPGHVQPRLPGALSFYDLRLEEVRAQQGSLAARYGVSAFCYWHYWFEGRRMLEKVVDDVVQSGVPDHPFCLGWANEDWGGRWVGAPRKILIKQTYGGDDDLRRHFDSMLPALTDRRYLRVDGRPLVYIYRPNSLPSASRLAEIWQARASEAGLPGVFLVGQSDSHGGPWRASPVGWDAVAPWHRTPFRARLAVEGRSADWMLSSLSRRSRVLPAIYSYRRWSTFMPELVPGEVSIPSVLPNWDNTPRAGRAGSVFIGSTPDLFERQVERAVELAEKSEDPALRMLFIRSWNEWAEGNYLEPDRVNGSAYLEAFRRAVTPDNVGAYLASKSPEIT